MDLSTIIDTDSRTGIDIVLSPAGCMAAVIRPDQTVHLHTAEYLHGWSDAKADNHLAQAAIVALVREVGILTIHQKGTDDALAMVPADLDESLRRRFISELFRTVSRNTDFSQEESSKQGGKVMKDAILFKILSMVLVLGYKDNPALRDIPAKVVWVMMNLRGVPTSVASSMTSNTPQPSGNARPKHRNQTTTNNFQTSTYPSAALSNGPST